MKPYASLVSLLAVIMAATTTASAGTMVKARQSSSLTYSVGILESDGTTASLPSQNGVVYQSFQPTTGPYLVHAEIDNDAAELATCVARDQGGNQVRTFGGPNFGGVESVDFVPAEGEQIYSLTCSPA